MGGVEGPGPTAAAGSIPGAEAPGGGRLTRAATRRSAWTLRTAAAGSRATGDGGAVRKVFGEKLIGLKNVVSF